MSEQKNRNLDVNTGRENCRTEQSNRERSFGSTNLSDEPGDQASSKRMGAESNEGGRLNSRDREAGLEPGEASDYEREGRGRDENAGLAGGPGAVGDVRRQEGQSTWEQRRGDRTPNHIPDQSQTST